MSDQPTQPIPPGAQGGWGQPPAQGPPGGWGQPPPPRPPRPGGRPPWWRHGWVLAVAGFLLGAAIGSVGAEQQQVRTVTVTSIVTSLVTVTPTTIEPTTTRTTRAPTTTTRRPKPTAPPTTRRRATTTTRPPARNCDPAYPDFCIPPPPPDLDCPDIGSQDFTVRSPDPHGFDADGDGVGCES